MIITARGDLETQSGHQIGIWRGQWDSQDELNPKIKRMRKKLGHCPKHEWTTFRIKTDYKLRDKLVCVKCELEDSEIRRKNYQEKAEKEGWNRQIWKCTQCNSLFRYRELIGEMCRPCRDRIEKLQLEDQRHAARALDKEELKKYTEMMKTCRTGVCDILKIHHKALKEDPERLPTERIIELTCGIEGREYYLAKRKERTGESTTTS